MRYANGYSEIIEFDLPNIGRRATHLRNLSFGPGVNPKVVMGNTFIVDITSNQYFHFLVDIIGQYEFLKQYVPNLNIVFVSDHEANVSHVFEKIGNSVIRDFASVYGINQGDVLSLSTGDSVIFENIFYFNNIFNNFINKYSGHNILYEGDGSDFIQYNLGLLRCVRGKFLEYAKEVESKKIFITRKKENALLLRVRVLHKKYTEGLLNDEEKVEFDASIARFGGLSYIYNNVNLRIQEPEDLQKMEDFF
jgi:hypothetical protein